MSERRPPWSRPTGADPHDAEEFYECPYCRRSFDDWPGACPDCGQIVVRVVDPRPVPDA